MVLSVEDNVKLMRERIRANREARGWSQEVLAEKIDRTREFVNKVENGKMNISYDSLLRFTLAFEIPIREFVDFD